MTPPTTYTESGRSLWAQWYWCETMRIGALVQRDEHPVGSINHQWFASLFEVLTTRSRNLRRQMKGKK